MNLKIKKVLRRARTVITCLFLITICLTLNTNPQLAQGAGKQDFWEKGTPHRFHGGEIRFSARETARPTRLTAEPVPIKRNGRHGFRPAGQAYRFGPSGLRFRELALLTLNYKNETGLPDDLIDIFYYNPDTGRWERMPRVGLDTVNKTVTAKITHFSIYAPGIRIGLVEEGISPYRTYFQHNQEKVDPATGNLLMENVDLQIPGAGGLDLTLKRIFSLKRYMNPIEQGYIHPDYNVPSPYELANGWHFCFPCLIAEHNDRYINYPIPKYFLTTENLNTIDFGPLVAKKIKISPTGSSGYKIYSTPTVVGEFYVHDQWSWYLRVLVRRIEIPKEGLSLVCWFYYSGEDPDAQTTPPPLLFSLETVELSTADGRLIEFEKGADCFRVSRIYDKSRLNCLAFSYANDKLSKIRDTLYRELTFTYSGNQIIVKYQGVTRVIYTRIAKPIRTDLTSVTIPINEQENSVTEYSYANGTNIRITYPSGGQSEYKVRFDIIQRYNYYTEIIEEVNRSFFRACEGGDIIKNLTYTYTYVPDSGAIPANPDPIRRSSAVITSDDYQIEYKYSYGCAYPSGTWSKYIFLDYPIETEKIHKTAYGQVLAKTVRTYESPRLTIPCIIQEDEYRAGIKVSSKYYEYDDFGQLLYEKDPMGHEKYYTYAYSILSGNSFSRFKSNNHGFTNAFYDNSQAPKNFWMRTGEAERNTDGLTRETYYCYDKFGNLIEKKEKYNAAGSSNSSYSWRITQYQYDNCTNNLIRITDPAGNITEYIYDSAHMRAYLKKERRQIRFPHESRWDNNYYLFREFTHDNWGRVTSQKTGLETSGETPVSGNVSAVTTYEYDGLNRITPKKEKSSGKEQARLLLWLPIPMKTWAVWDRSNTATTS